MSQNKLLIDIGSTYFKVCANGNIEQHFRDFNKDIFDDLTSKCNETISKFKKDEVFICSSANGGLTTLIIGVTNSFSLKFATNIAYNSGINIINTVLYQDIDTTSIPSDLIDVVIIVGGINSVSNVFDEKLFNFLQNLNYSNVVFAGTTQDAEYLNSNIKNLVVIENIINNKLHVVEEPLKEYLTNLYQADIEGKEDIKHLYDLTSNQIYSTPYIVNKTLPLIDTKFAAVNPFILIDIGGATTDIHYSKDLSMDNMVTQNEYDRLVFKKLGVYKSKESLIFAAKNNEFVYELLAHLKVTENIFNEDSPKALRVLMQLAIFLVLYKVSDAHPLYIKLKLNLLKSIVLTGGITKVLTFDEATDIISFFYKKILNSDIYPSIIMDYDYDIWTLGITQQ
ncbi:MAG: glutamate mutase L [Arcobacter sp.]|jgi:mRNA-degrading endonuclease HigB of HigAB toxin-antitoxin module|uniref:glutamate mutase L n=1 Tax=Arcobacter sp. TaxID=1872629 RepID=UPI00259039DE|nr:glutamate mutase L [Arcobacter sp.]MDD3008886.1 glutamate mutase L [Arcobacter sp.]MDY3203648.1 glutamate mutase L [Arcobacter sp.]